MSSLAEQLMVEVLQRLEAINITGLTVRRDHLTPATRAECPLLDLRQGDDKPSTTSKQSSGCEWERVLEFDVSIQTRADEAHTASDPFVIEVYKALSNVAESYPFAAIIIDKGIRRAPPEIADADALETIIGFELKYRCQPWTLDAVPEEV